MLLDVQKETKDPTLTTIYIVAFGSPYQQMFAQ